MSRTNWASLHREQWRPEAAPLSGRHGGGMLPVVSQRQSFRERRHTHKLSRQPHSSSRGICGFRHTNTPPPSRQSRGQEKKGAPTIAQQAPAVMDELILAAVHATGRPEPLRGLSCHSTAAHGPAQTKSPPRLLRFIQGVMTERLQTFQQRRHHSGQASSPKAEERQPRDKTNTVLACGSVQSGKLPRPRTLAPCPFKNVRPVDLRTLKRHRLSN